MSLDEIREKVRSIGEAGSRDGEFDYENAHALEDELRRDFINHVAEHGPEKLSKMATAVLVTEEMDFPRYCA